MESRYPRACDLDNNTADTISSTTTIKMTLRNFLIAFHRFLCGCWIPDDDDDDSSHGFTAFENDILARHAARPRPISPPELRWGDNPEEDRSHF
jgi:hypothetical protein